MENNIIQEGNAGKSTNNSSKIFLIIAILLAVTVLAAMIFFIKYFTKTEEKINAKVHRTEIYIDEDLVFVDNTKGAKEWLWEFGNGDSSDKQQGHYKFKEPGSYVVRLTVNKNLREQFIIIVHDPLPVIIQDTVLFVTGPTGGVVFEELRLEANGIGEIFEWSFGETGRVDIIGRSALYTYSKPGTYKVKLRSDKSGELAVHEVRIIDPTADLTMEIEAPGSGAQKLLDDLRAQIQAIADGADFNSKYNYILTTFLCNNDNVKVNVEMEGARKQVPLYTYLMGLTFSNRIIIEEVKVSLMPNSECANILHVKQVR